MEEKVKKELKKISEIIEKYEGKKLPENFIDDIKEYDKLVNLQIELPYKKELNQKNKIRTKISKKIKKLENKYSPGKFQALVSTKRYLEEGEDPASISSKLKTAFEIANRINNNFYEGRKVVNPYLVFSDIEYAEKKGDTAGGATCHSIAQKRKDGKIGKLKIPAELIYRKIDRVLSMLFGEYARIKFKYGENDWPLITLEFCEYNLKEDTYKKIFPEKEINKFSEENYKDPKVKKELFNEIEWRLNSLTPEDKRFLNITHEKYMEKQLDNAGIKCKKTEDVLDAYCKTINGLLSKKKKVKK